MYKDIIYRRFLLKTINIRVSLSFSLEAETENISDPNVYALRMYISIINSNLFK